MEARTEPRSLANVPLNEHCVLRSDEFDEVRSFLRHKNLGLYPARPRSLAEGMRATINAAYLSRMYVAYMEYGAELEMAALAPLDTDFGVHLPLRGWIESQNGHATVHRGAGHTVVTSPANRHRLMASPDCSRLLLSVNRDALTNHLAILLGELPKSPLAFAHDVDPANDGSRRLANAVRYAAQEFERKDSVTEDRIVVEQFEQYFMTLTLMSQPSNYTDALKRRDNGVGPKDVKRAIDYIRSNLDMPITLEELVVVSGVPGRTLYQHFHDFMGISPMAYIKNARYQRVRRDLLVCDGESTVTEIAGHWGFSHMGRFAADYRRRYGERPSETLHRRKPYRF